MEPFFPPVLYADGFALLQGGDYKGAIAQLRRRWLAIRSPLTFERMEAMEKAAAVFRDGAADRHPALKVAIELIRIGPNRIACSRACIWPIAGGRRHRRSEIAVRLIQTTSACARRWPMLIEARRCPEAERAHGKP